MPYIGQRPTKGDENNFKILDDISSYTLTFDGSDSSVVSAANDTITSLTHRFVHGQRVTYNKGGGTVIAGLSDGVYYIIKEDHNTIKLATSASNATNGIAVNITGVGAGSSHTLNVAFDGINTKFKATHTSGQKAKITRSAQLVISMNGVIQQPHDTATPSTGFGFDLDGTIVFSQAPVSSDVFWAHVLTNNNVSFEISDNDIDNFTGDGSTTEFNLSKSPPDNRNVLVTIDGVVQYPNDPDGTARAYVVVENVLTFNSAPASGVEIQVRHIGFAGSTSGSGGVTSFYGRTGAVVLKNTDNITVNDAAITGNATITGNLTVDGTTTTLDTVLTEVDKLEVGANNTTVGVAITQNGTGDLIRLYDGTSQVVTVDDVGNIGIGTDNPTKKLDIVGFGTDNGIRVGDNHFYAFSDDDVSTKGSPTFRNLNNNANTVLRIIPNGTGTSQFEFFANDYYSNTTSWKNLRILADPSNDYISVNTAAASTVSGSSKHLVFETEYLDNGTVRSNPNQLFLKNDGNIGIGSTIPAEKLDVSGKIKLGSNGVVLSGDDEYGSSSGYPLKVTTSYGYLNVGPYNASYSHFVTDRSKFYFNKRIIVDEGIVASYNEDLVLATDIDEERIRCKKDTGFVGIRTDNPQQRLTVVGNGQSTGGILVKNVAYANNQDRPYLTIGSLNWDGTTTNWGTHGFQHRIKTNNGGTSRITIDTLVSGASKEILSILSSGRVGIGTDAPLTELHVHGETFTDITIHSQRTSGNIGGINFRKGGVTSGIMTAQYLVDVSGNHYFHSQGSERLKISSDGDLLITGSDNAELKLKCGTSTGNNIIAFLNSSGTTKGNIFYDSDNDFMVFKTNGTGSDNERLRIDAAGVVLKGHTAASADLHDSQTVIGRSPRFQLHGANAVNAGAALISWKSGTGSYYSPNIYLARSGSDTIGTNGLVANNAPIGAITFNGDDGGEFAKAAVILCEVDGTSGADNMPGRLIFKTTPSGTQVPEERLRIESDGNIKAKTGTQFKGFHLVKADGGTVAQLVGHGSDNDEGGVNLWYGGTKKVQILSNGSSYLNGGNVGIGTEIPDSPLHVHKGSAGTVSADGNAVLALENSNHCVLNLMSPTDKSCYIMMGDPDDINAGQIRYDNNINALQFEVNADERMRIDDSGRVRIGSDNGTEYSINNDSNAILQLSHSTGPKLIMARVDTSVSSGDDLGVIDFHSTDQSNALCARMEVQASQSHSDSQRGTDFRFYTTKNGTTTQREVMRLNDTGSMSLNATASSNSSVLYVNTESASTGIEDIHTTENQSAYTIVNNSHHTGAGTTSSVGIGTLTGNRTKTGFRNDVECGIYTGTSQTGSRVSFYGIHNTATSSKFVYHTLGAYNLAQLTTHATNQSIPNTSIVTGVYGYAQGYPYGGSRVGASKTCTIYGGFFLGYRGGDVNAGHCHGVYSKALNSNHYGNFGDMTGVYGECEQDHSTTIVNAYAFRGVIDRDGGTITNSYILHGGWDVTTNCTNRYGVYITGSTDNLLTGDCTITGDITAPNNKSFRIAHPLVGLTTTKDLVHTAIEGPQVDLIYRGKTTLVAGISTINIDTKAGMTEGTFVALNRDVQCFTTNETGWTNVKGSVTGNQLTIIAQENTCTDTISWMVVGERQDDAIKTSRLTDADGKLILEHDKKPVIKKPVEDNVEPVEPDEIDEEE